MLKAEIISVGTELLMGQIANGDTQFIAQRLPQLGIALLHTSVVGDNAERLLDAVRCAKERSDVVIFTGGLGPTDDDLTKETAAEAFGKKLVFDERSYEVMKNYFAMTNRAMPENNIKQAYVPEGCIVLENRNGTAPGCIIEDNGKYAVMLPGPPRELQPMFKEGVAPFLSKISGVCMKSRVLRVFGLGESQAAQMLDELIKGQTNPTIAPYAKEGEVTFRITASAESEPEAENLLSETADKIYEILGDYIYAEGDEASLAEVVVKSLTEKGLKMATAESCTGGGIGKMITSIPGASEVYKFGFITYANEAKEKMLGVKHETLEKYGAVSEETAREMAMGAREKSGSDIAVSVTGIAGPGGGSEKKPVGLVYIGVCDKNGCEAFKFNQAGDRERVRQKSALCALDIVRRRCARL